MREEHTMQDSGKTVPHSLKHLIIRTVPDGFLFGKVSSNGVGKSKLRLFAAVDFPDKFVSFLQENHWSDRPDLKVSIVDFTNRFLLVPTHLADDAALETYFRFQNGAEGAQQIYTAPFDDGKQLFCWEIPSERDRLFEKTVPNMTLWSSSYLIANWTYHQAEKTDTPTLSVHLYGHSMQLFMADTHRLLFANTFVVRNIEEIAYFLLRCLEQTGLDPATVNTFLCSEHNLTFAEFRELLAPYLANLFEAEFTLNPDQLFRLVLHEADDEEDLNEEEA